MRRLFHELTERLKYAIGQPHSIGDCETFHARGDVFANRGFADPERDRDLFVFLALNGQSHHLCLPWRQGERADDRPPLFRCEERRPTLIVAGRDEVTRGHCNISGKLVVELIVLKNVLVVVIKATVAFVASHDVPRVGSVQANGIRGNLDTCLAGRTNDVEHEKSFLC